MREQERNTITSFLQRWAQVKGHAFNPSDIDFPEDHLSTLDEQERRHPIDAKVDSLKVTLEHTSCDALVDQRKYNGFFKDTLGPIEEALKGGGTNALTITIPYEAALGKTKKEWKQTCSPLMPWLVNHLDALNESSLGVQSFQISDLPFNISISIRKSDNPGVRFHIGVQENGDTFDQRLYDIAERKIKKLQSYKPKGYSLILLVENDDFSLMNADKIHSSIQRRLSLFNQVDEVWHVDSTLSQKPEYFHFDGRRMLRVTSKDKEYVSF